MTAFIPDEHTLLIVVPVQAEYLQRKRGVIVRGGAGTNGLVRQTSKLRRLPSGRLSNAGRHNVAHDHFINVLILYAAARDCSLDDGGAELSRGKCGKATVEQAYWSADCRDNYNVAR